ncbi:hypothetical protein [Pseudomonas sp. 11/12A]|uniref:hypothetical protein n=1 Tax=Pseudomonas sp. 11/12A TaxID=1506582 RepID=UPI000647E6A2|nr:hypothetical protein [Pseudomonas sp. 11/12A]
MVISNFQAYACLAGWRDSLMWGICVRPGMEPEGETAVSDEFYKRLLGISKQNQLVSGDSIYGITTGEDILNFSERDAAGSTVAHYRVVEQRIGYLGEGGSITWHRTEVKSKQD